MSSSSASRRRLRRLCLLLIGGLYVASVPWYRDPEAPLELWLGLPDWVAVATLCYVAVAVVNAVAWSVTDVPDELAKGDESMSPVHDSRGAP